MRLVLSALLAAALSLGALPARGQDKEEPDKAKPDDPTKAAADYYPLKEGATWTYQVKGAKVGDNAKASEKEFTVKVTGVDKDGVAKLETKEKDKLIATEEVQVKKD